MGKGRDKRKKAKEEKGGGRNKAKQDKKQKEKNLEKHSRRLHNLDSDSENEDNVELLLAQYRQSEKKKKEVIVEECARPSPRVNATFMPNPANSNELVLFGGEYWNGERTDSYNDLYRYTVDKKQWRSVSSPVGPSPRSSHQAVCFKNFMVTFGGEFTSPSQSQFYHHKDLWRLNLNTWQWEECKVKEKSSPQPRSGHRMTLWKRTVLMFGGFHDTLTSAGYYFDDMWALDNVDLQPSWRKLEATGEAPSKRSAVCLAVYADTLFLYGGFSVEGKQQKGITHNDFYQFNLATCTWNRIKKAGIPPSIRSGMTVAVSARKAFFFGGVMDYEEKNDIKSRFYNDVFVFNMDTRRWFPLVLRAKKAVGASRRAKKGARGGGGAAAGDGEGDASSLAANLEKLQPPSATPAAPAAQGGEVAAAAAASASESSDSDSDLEGLRWNPSSMPALPKAKKKVKKVAEKKERKKPGANPSKGDAAAAPKAVRTGYEINKQQAPVGGRPGEADEEEDEEAPQGIPIYLGTQIIGYEPVPEPEKEVEKRADERLMFIASEGYDGSKRGYVFRMGTEGLGYYEDDQPEVDEEMIRKLVHKEGVHFDATADVAESRSKFTYGMNEAGQITPCGRFGTQLCCAGNYLYLFGGQFEEGSREVTLSDMYRLNANTLETFEVLEEMDLAEQEWYESEDDDTPAPKSGKKQKKGGDAESDESDEEESEESEGSGSDEEEDGSSSDGEKEKGKAKAPKKAKEVKGGAKGRVRSKRDQLRQQLGADEGVPTPEPHEPLKDFYKRTLEFWMSEARTSSDPSDRTAADAEKAFRKDAFRFCAVRYHECRPILEQIEFLDKEAAKEEEWRAKKEKEASEKDRDMKKLARRAGN